MTNLKDKTVLVVGGSSGFGLAVATMAANVGARVTIIGRDANKLAKAVAGLRQISVESHGEIAAVEAEDEWDAVFEKTGTFDHLISTLGGFMGGGFLDAPTETIRRAIEEKLFANLALARRASPWLKSGGSMVFTAGSGGRPHGASGAIVGNDAIRTLVQGLAVELAPRARVNAVAPTWTRTPLWRHLPQADVDATEEQFARSIPLGRTATIEEVASAYLFLMENTFVTGQTIVVDGGLTLVS